MADADALAAGAGRSSASDLAALAHLAVIVPIGPDDECWRGLLNDLSALPATAEVCLVRCTGSVNTGDTEPRPSTRSACWRHLITLPGRAVQQNHGARASARRWLWFVHADSRLAPTTLRALARFIGDDASSGIGYFDLAFHDGSALMRLNSGGAWLRSHLLKLPFGDQGLLMRRTHFDQLGGFDETCGPGEDHALIWRARALRLPIQPVGAALYTSARKYSERGWLATTAHHLIMSWRQARLFSRQSR